MLAALLLIVIQDATFWAHPIKPPDAQFPTVVGESSNGYVFANYSNLQEPNSRVVIVGKSGRLLPDNVNADSLPIDVAGPYVAYSNILAKDSWEYRLPTVDTYILDGFSIPDGGSGATRRTRSFILPTGRTLKLIAYPTVGGRPSNEDAQWRCPDWWVFLTDPKFADFGWFCPDPVVAFRSGYVACTFIEGGRPAGDFDDKSPLRAARWKSSSSKAESSPNLKGVKHVTAEAVNNRGAVAGRILINSKMKTHIWKGTKLTVIDPPEGGPSDAFPCPILVTDDDYVVGRWIDKETGRIIGQAWISFGGNGQWLREVVKGSDLPAVYDVKLAANFRDLLATTDAKSLKGWYRLVGQR